MTFIERHPIVAILCAVAGVFALMIGVWAFRVVTADVKGAGDAEIETSGGDYRIAAYDHFHDLCAAVQATEDRLAAQLAELEDPATTPQRASQLRANVNALRGSRAENIRDYNADASKDYTVGQFRDSNLPYRIDPTRETTQCES